MLIEKSHRTLMIFTFKLLLSALNFIVSANSQIPFLSVSLVIKNTVLYDN